jgi:hypothetical protein
MFHIWNNISAKNDSDRISFMPKQSHKKSAQKARRNPARRKAPEHESVKFPEARGRTVEMVELSLDSDFQCVSIRFKDNTDLTVVIDTALRFQAQYSEWKAGNQKVLKRWPVIRGG